MAFSVPTQPIPYVLEADRTRPPEWQTTFHIRPRTGATANKIAAGYGLAQEMRGGRQKISDERLTQADIKAFVLTVDGVDNYFVSPDSDQSFTGVLCNGNTPVMQYGGRDFKKVGRIDGDAALRALAQLMAPSDVQEIFDAANSVSALLEGEKKSLNS